MAEQAAVTAQHLGPTLCVGPHCFATLLRRGQHASLERNPSSQSKAYTFLHGATARDAGASRSSAVPRRAWDRGVWTRPFSAQFPLDTFLIFAYRPAS